MADKAIAIVGIGGLLYYLYQSYSEGQSGEEGANNLPIWMPPTQAPRFDPNLILEIGEYIVGQMIFDFLGRKVMLVYERVTIGRMRAQAMRYAIQGVGDRAAQAAAAKGLSKAEQDAARAAAEKRYSNYLNDRAMKKQVVKLGPKTASAWGEGILARANNGLRVLSELEAKAIQKSKLASENAARLVKVAQEVQTEAANNAAKKAIQDAEKALQQADRAGKQAAEQAAKVLEQETKILEKTTADNLAKLTAEKASQEEAGKLLEQRTGQIVGGQLEKGAAGAALKSGGERAAGQLAMTKIVSKGYALAAARKAAEEATARALSSRATVITSATKTKEGAKIIAEAARSAYNSTLKNHALRVAENASKHAIKDAKALSKGKALTVMVKQIGRGIGNIVSRIGAEMAARAAGTRAAFSKITSGAATMAGKITAMSARAAAMLTNPITVAFALVSIAAITLIITLDINDEAFQGCSVPGDFALSDIPFPVRMLIEFIPGVGDLFSILAPMVCLGARCGPDEDMDIVPIPIGMLLVTPWCFKKAHPDFDCHSFLCYARYPEWENNGMLHTFAHATKRILMDTGTVPMSQPMINGKPGVQSGLLWYEDINTEKDKWDIVAGVAWHQCPPGYTDIGAFCLDWRLRETAVLRDCPVAYDYDRFPNNDVNWINDGLICREPLGSTFELLPCAPGDRDDGLLCWGDEDYDKDLDDLSPDDFRKRMSGKFTDKFGEKPDEWYKKDGLWFSGEAPIAAANGDTYNPQFNYKFAAPDAEGNVPDITVIWNGQPFKLMAEFGGPGYSPQYWSCYGNKICKIALENNQIQERDTIILSYTNWADSEEQDPEPYSLRSLLKAPQVKPSGPLAQDAYEAAGGVSYTSKFSPGGWWQEMFPEIREKERERVKAWNAKLAEWDKTNTWKDDVKYDVGDIVRFQMDEEPITVDEMMNGKEGKLANYVCFDNAKKYSKKEKFIDIGGMKSRTNDLFEYTLSNSSDARYMPPNLDSNAWALTYSTLGEGARNEDNTWVGQQQYDLEAEDKKKEFQDEIDAKRKEIDSKYITISEINDKIRETYILIDHHRTDVIEKDLNFIDWKLIQLREANAKRDFWRKIEDREIRRRDEQYIASGGDPSWYVGILRDDIAVMRLLRDLPAEKQKLEDRLQSMKNGGYDAKVAEFRKEIEGKENEKTQVKTEIDNILLEIPKIEKQQREVTATKGTMYYSKGDIVVYKDRQVYVSLYSDNHDVLPTDMVRKVWLRLSDKAGDPYAIHEIKNNRVGEGETTFVKRKLVASTVAKALEIKERFTVKQKKVFDPEMIYKSGDIIIFRGDEWKARSNPEYVYDSYGLKFKGMTRPPDIRRLEGPDNVFNYLKTEAWFPTADTFNCRKLYSKGRNSVVIYALHEYEMKRSLDAVMRKELANLFKRDFNNDFCGLSPVLMEEYWEKKQYGWKGKEPHP
jgi:hypothetical protein